MRENRQPNCPDERDIARYLARTLSVEQRRLMEKHFAYCSRCNSVLADLVRLAPKKDEEVPAVSLTEAWLRIEAELDRQDSISGLRQAASEAANKEMQVQRTAGKPGRPLRPPRVIELRPGRMTREAGHAEYSLAADSKVPKAPGEVTFLSNDETILGKFLRNEKTNELFLFLACQDMERMRGVFVRAYNPVLAEIIEGVVDQEGVLCIGKVPSLDLEETRIEVYLPEASFALKPREWRDRLLDEGRIDVDSPEGYTLRIEIVESGTKRKYRLDFSDLQTAHPGCALRVFATEEDRRSEVKIGREGVGWLLKEDPQEKRTTLRAYVMKSL